MEFLNDTALWGNPLAEWLQALGYILGSLVMARVVYALFKRVLKRWAARTSTKWDDVVVDQIEEPIAMGIVILGFWFCLLYTSPSPRDRTRSRMPSSA